MKTTLAVAKLSSTFPAAVLLILCVVLTTATFSNLDAQVPTWQPPGPVVQQPIIQQPYYPPQETYTTPAPNVIIGEVVYGNETIGGIAPSTTTSGITQTEPVQDFGTAPGELVLGENEQAPPAPDESAAQPPAAPAINTAGKDTSDPNIANEIIRSLEDELFKSHAQVVELYGRVEFLENQLTNAQNQIANDQQNDASKPDSTDNPNAKSDNQELAAMAVSNEELVNALTLARQQNSDLRTELEQLTANFDQQKQAASREIELRQANEQAAMKEQYERKIEKARAEIETTQQKIKAEKTARRQQVAQLESQLLASRNKLDANENAIRESAETIRQEDAKRAAQAQRIAKLETELTEARSKISAKDDAIVKASEAQRQQEATRASQLQKITELESLLAKSQTKYEAKLKEIQENKPKAQPKDSPSSRENPFQRTTENETPDADSATPDDRQDSFFEDAMLKLQKLHDDMFKDIEAGRKRISERFSKRIERLDSSAPGFEAEKKRLNQDQQRLLREQELKIRRRWQKKLDSHMESTLETV